MPDVHLKPAQSLVEGLTRAELLTFAQRHRLQAAPSGSKKQLIAAVTSRFNIDELASALAGFFPKRRPAGCDKPVGEVRFDRAARLAGSMTIQVYSRSNPGLGRLFFEHDGSCIVFRIGHTQLFLENRWPLVARDAGRLPLNRLHAAFVARGRLHPEAGAPPPANRPFIIDEGEYGVRNARLRLELSRFGPLSFSVKFLRYRPPTGRPEYLLQPIA